MVCLDTLGQDREFTADELRFALETVQHFKTAWEASEKKSLQQDVEWKLRNIEFDNNYKDFFAAQDADERARLEEEHIQEDIDRRNANAEPDLTEEGKAELIKYFTFSMLTKSLFAPEALLEH